MKNDSSYGLIGILVVLLIFISGGYWYSCSSRTKVTKIWKQTLWEDRTNRMREANVKTKYIFVPSASPDIKIITEGQTLHLKRDSIKPYTADEGDFLGDQQYLLLKNPVKLENLDSLFRLKLKENGLDYKTAVSLYNNGTDKKTFYGQEDVKVLHDYLKLTYKVDIQDIILLEGYVKGGWIESIVWGTSYYVVLSIVLVILGILIVKRKQNNKSSKSPDQFVSENEQPQETEQALPDELVEQKVEQLTEPEVEPEAEPVLPTDNLVRYDERMYSLIYGEKTITLTRKVFKLFCYLSQGKDYFQPYEYLYEALGNKNTESDKKTVEQLAFHLRRDLSKSIPILNIETIWAKGYQIKGKDEMEIRIERIENKEV
ncbi:helix-turn-helix domain-containing protein [Parabacteroides goldsteinii]